MSANDEEILKIAKQVFEDYNMKKILLSRKRKCEEEIAAAVKEPPVDEFKWLVPAVPPLRLKKKVYNKADLDALDLVRAFGDDKFGRRIIVVSCCNMPPPDECSHEKLTMYLINAIDEYVEMDFVVVFLSHGLENYTCPTFTWVNNVIGHLHVKFIKHIKGLYIVHPSKYVKNYWDLMKPRFSKKMVSRVLFFHHLYHFQQIIEKRCIVVPDKVQEYDNYLLQINHRAADAAAKVTPKKKIQLDTAEFGVSLLHIQYKHPRCERFIPPILENCILYLSERKEMRTKNLFRRTLKKDVMSEMQEQCNRGVQFRFRAAHVAASFLKTFLRELEEPLLTYKLFKDVSTFLEWPKPERYDRATTLFLEKLSPEHYLVLKYLVEFLDEVQQESLANNMDIHNLALVFGPNLIWPENGPMNIYQIENVVAFTEFLLENYMCILLVSIL